MRKVTKALTAILVISMIAMVVAPVLAARTPKDDQVFVKVVDSTGKAVGKIGVMIYEGSDWDTREASTSYVYTKGSGVAVISLIKDTIQGSWSSGQTFTIIVYTPYSGAFYFYDNSFYGTLSASIEVTIPAQP